MYMYVQCMYMHVWPYVCRYRYMEPYKVQLGGGSRNTRTRLVLGILYRSTSLTCGRGSPTPTAPTETTAAGSGSSRRGASTDEPLAALRHIPLFGPSKFQPSTAFSIEYNDKKKKKKKKGKVLSDQFIKFEMILRSPALKL